MTIPELSEWIETHYGTPRVTAANGVCVAVVSVYGGVALGMGNMPSSALYDLYCDLCLPTARQPVQVELLPWERKRRADLDAERS